MTCKCCTPTVEINEQKIQAIKEIESYARELMKDFSNVDRDTLRKIRECISFIEEFENSPDNESANEAKAIAESAKATADNANGTANYALTTAEGALLAGQTAKATADEAKATADNATQMISDNVEEIGRATVIAEEAKETAEVAETVGIIATRRSITAQSLHNMCESDRVHNISHRGWGNAPENTIPAYQESVQRGYKYVEADVTKTADGVYVLLHDETIDRTSTGTGAINQLTLNQARQYDYGSWKNSRYTGTSIPTFEEFIRFCRDTGIHPYIEFKSFLTPADAQPLYDIVKAHGMHNNCTWFGFDFAMLEAIRTVDPLARVGLSVSGIASSHITQLESLMATNKNVFICPYLPTLSSAMITMCRNADIPIEVWSGNITNEDIINADPYVTGFMCNTAHAHNALGDNNGVVIFNNPDNPIYGSNRLKADFTEYKTLDIYINLPSYQTMVTMQLEYGGSGNLGGVTGFPKYSIRVGGTLLDNQKYFHDFVVALSDDKRELYIYRSGFIRLDALVDTTKTYWNERNYSYYCVYKVVGHM